MPCLINAMHYLRYKHVWSQVYKSLVSPDGLLLEVLPVRHQKAESRFLDRFWRFRFLKSRLEQLTHLKESTKTVQDPVLGGRTVGIVKNRFKNRQEPVQELERLDSLLSQMASLPANVELWITHLYSACTIDITWILLDLLHWHMAQQHYKLFSVIA